MNDKTATTATCNTIFRIPKQGNRSHQTLPPICCWTPVSQFVYVPYLRRLYSWPSCENMINETGSTYILLCYAVRGGPSHRCK